VDLFVDRKWTYSVTASGPISWPRVDPSRGRRQGGGAVVLVWIGRASLGQARKTTSSALEETTYAGHLAGQDVVSVMGRALRFLRDNSGV
jgi:hypothetical protein